MSFKRSTIRGIGTVLLIILLLGLLSACGSSDKTTTESSENTPISVVTTIENIEESMVDSEVDTSEDSDNASAASIINRDRKIDNYYYEFVMTTGEEKVAGFKLWVAGNKARYDAIDEGQSLYLDYDKGEGYLYMPSENLLMKTPIETTSNEWESPFLFAGEIDDGTLSSMKQTGTEIIDGKTCYVFEADGMGTKANYYVWKEEGLIVKMMIETDDQPSYGYYFKDLTIGGTFETELTLPEDAKIMNP